MPEDQGPNQSMSEFCNCKSNQSNLRVQVSPNAVNGPAKLQSHFQVSSQALIAKNTKGITMALPKTLLLQVQQLVDLGPVHLEPSPESYQSGS